MELNPIFIVYWYISYISWLFCLGHSFCCCCWCCCCYFFLLSLLLLYREYNNHILFLAKILVYNEILRCNVSMAVRAGMYLKCRIPNGLLETWILADFRWALDALKPGDLVICYLFMYITPGLVAGPFASHLCSWINPQQFVSARISFSIWLHESHIIFIASIHSRPLRWQGTEALRHDNKTIKRHKDKSTEGHKDRTATPKIPNSSKYISATFEEVKNWSFRWQFKLRLLNWNVSHWGDLSSRTAPFHTHFPSFPT